jgi:NADP-dependent 3-hydroxy acid dehydrogenase YdfG
VYARGLAERGWDLVLVARRADRLEALASAGDILPVPADVSDPASVDAAAAGIRDALGAVDLVVANAGAMLAAPFESADTGEWDRMLDVNVRGLLRTGRAFAADLIVAAQDGRPADLVFVGSIGGHTVFPNYAVYGATKAAVAHLTRNLRAELGPRGVRVKDVEPGLTATELGDDMRDAAGREVLDALRRQIAPLPPEDVADAIAYIVTRPRRVAVNEVLIRPTDQAF